MTAPETLAEIEHSFAEVVARRGVSGRVVVHDRSAELHGVGSVVAIDLGDLIAQWSVLPADMRATKIDLAVERLQQAVARDLPPPASPTDIAPLVGKIAGTVLVLATVAGTVFWLAKSNFFGADVVSAAASSTTEANGKPEFGVVPKVEDRESCEASRRRIYAGATSLDVDPAGWLIEIWLARDGEPAPLREDAALRDVTHERLSGRLGALEPAAMSWIETGDARRVRVRFEGGYLHPFMKADGRDRFVALTDQLAEATHSSHAALYARCAHSNTRDIGAYYRGVDAGGAAASLLFAQGLFTNPPVIDESKFGGEANALSALSRHTAGIELSTLEELIRDNGGRVVTTETGGTRGVGLNFALSGPTRAQQAARALAKQRKVQ